MSIDWQQRPIDHWPGELTKHRIDSPFKAGWRTTEELLERELRMLNTRAVVALVALDAKDIRLDGRPKANARPRHPGVILSFTCKHGPLRYACDRFFDFTDNVRAIALGLEALRKVERYGIVNSGEQYRGFSELPSGTVMGLPMGKDEAWRVLVDLAEVDYIDTDPSHRVAAHYVTDAERTADDIDVLYRQAAKLHHPDNGGDPDLFRRATEARDVLVAS